MSSESRSAAYCHVHGYTDCGCVCACEPPNDMGEDSFTGADIPEPVGAGSRPVPLAAYDSRADTWQHISRVRELLDAYKEDAEKYLRSIGREGWSVNVRRV